jgi:glucose-6-phosphate 1-dehydrogenase
MIQKTPFIFILFGATGDLAQKKIVPALLDLYSSGEWGEVFKKSRIVAFSRRAWSDEEYHSFIRPSLDKKYPPEAIKDFLGRVSYAQGTFSDEASYAALKKMIAGFEGGAAAPLQRLYYLAIQPSFYTEVFNGLAKAGLNQKNGDVSPRIIIEKPFGRDTDSAEELNGALDSAFPEDDVYRIDHYLGKAGLDEFLQRRETDSGFESRLNGKEVESISIRMLEDIDIQGRGDFYDETGTLRDVGQNHLLEMLAITIMDLPRKGPNGEDPGPEQFQNARAAAIETLSPITDLGKMIRGQYEGYRSEDEVDVDSNTETYFKIETVLAGERWQGTKVLFEAGKALSEKASDITILFKDGSTVIIDVQKPIALANREAYETLIEKALEGDRELFVSIEEVRAEWRFITPIWESLEDIPLKIYKKGASAIG